VKLCVCACFLEQFFMFVFVFFLNKTLKLLLGKRWPTLSFSCQKQEQCLLLFHSRRAKSIHCDHFWKVCKTAEGGRDAAVLTLYKSRGETESWKKCVWRESERERAHEQWALLSNARGVCPNCGAHSLTRPFEHCNTSATCFEHCFRGLLQLHWHFTNHVCSAPEAWYALDDSLL